MAWWRRFNFFSARPSAEEQTAGDVGESLASKLDTLIDQNEKVLIELRKIATAMQAAVEEDLEGGET